MEITILCGLNVTVLLDFFDDYLFLLMQNLPELSKETDNGEALISFLTKRLLHRVDNRYYYPVETKKYFPIKLTSEKIT
ncbi:hypothetical protein BpHYR1_046764 [Brachionus plicatilis]|uniref:Uncharacterized protein n=1 Tax=Brachionus plicatilis TaxID=10195 RepID=A0A3M7SDP1_BRAPC|nr:hypothetical protein BpHYR1_046764 [Brachionus plicatilis]